MAALGQHIQLRHQLGADDREHLLHLVAVLSREALAHTLDDRVQVRIADAVVIDVFRPPRRNGTAAASWECKRQSLSGCWGYAFSFAAFAAARLLILLWL